MKRERVDLSCFAALGAGKGGRGLGWSVGGKLLIIISGRL